MICYWSILWILGTVYSSLADEIHNLVSFSSRGFGNSIYLDKSIRETIDRVSIVDILAGAIELYKLFVIRAVTAI